MNVIRWRHNYAVSARFATHLYRVAHNRLIDHYRRASHGTAKSRPRSLRVRPPGGI
ncbi:MAG: hypothetical protein HY526_07490 [Betaproteobacteria bacterium]|nr:hypothetical protein [Betaproteobacteria bacterium]